MISSVQMIPYYIDFEYFAWNIWSVQTFHQYFYVSVDAPMYLSIYLSLKFKFFSLCWYLEKRCRAKSSLSFNRILHYLDGRSQPGEAAAMLLQQQQCSALNRTFSCYNICSLKERKGKKPHIWTENHTNFINLQLTSYPSTLLRVMCSSQWDTRKIAS